MGIFDKIFGDESDAQPKNFQVTFNEHKFGMTLTAALDGTPIVTGGEVVIFLVGKYYLCHYPLSSCVLEGDFQRWATEKTAVV